MKDYAEIVFAPHLGLVERSEMVANAFNQSAANAADYLNFKRAQDTRVSLATAKAAALEQSQLGPDLQWLADLIGHAGGALTPAEVAAGGKKLDALRGQHAKEKNDIERLKPEVDSLSKLYGILASAEELMNGFNVQAKHETRAAKGTLTTQYGVLTSDEFTSRTQEATLDGLAEMLKLIDQDNKSASKKAEFSDYLKDGLTTKHKVAAPRTASFRRKP